MTEQFLPHLWYKDKLGSFQLRSKEEEFVSPSLRQSLTPSIFPTMYAGVDDEIAAGRTEDMDHAARYLANTFLIKLKHIVCSNTIQNMEDADLLQFTVIRLLVWAHGTGLKFLFSKLDDEFTATLDIQKIIKPPLQVINVNNTSNSSVGHTTTF